MLELFRRTLARGVKVKLLVNSRRSNETLLQAAYELAAPKLAALGVEIWEYQGPDMLHVKAVLIGDRGYIGSANVDPGSERKNTETGMIFDSPDLAADLRAFLADIERDSKVVARDGKLRPGAWAPHESDARKVVWPVLKNASRFPPLYNRL
jgi:putative cardiolipin synthase